MHAIAFCLAFSIPSHSTHSLGPLYRSRLYFGVQSCAMHSWLQTWEPRIVTKEAEKQLSGILTKCGEYCGWDQLSSSRRSEIERESEGLMSQEQARSLRKQLLVEKCRSGCGRMCGRMCQLLSSFCVYWPCMAWLSGVCKIV